MDSFQLIYYSLPAQTLTVSAMLRLGFFASRQYPLLLTFIVVINGQPHTKTFGPSLISVLHLPRESNIGWSGPSMLFVSLSLSFNSCPGGFADCKSGWGN